MKKSRRYCLNCKKVTTFKLKKRIGHSECSECGGCRAWSKRHAKLKGKLGR